MWLKLTFVPESCQYDVAFGEDIYTWREISKWPRHGITLLRVDLSPRVHNHPTPVKPTIPRGYST